MRRPIGESIESIITEFLAVMRPYFSALLLLGSTRRSSPSSGRVQQRRLTPYGPAPMLQLKHKHCRSRTYSAPAAVASPALRSAPTPAGNTTPPAPFVNVRNKAQYRRAFSTPRLHARVPYASSPDPRLGVRRRSLHLRGRTTNILRSAIPC